MENIFSSVSFETPSYTLRQEEYIDPVSGLIYCKACRTPRQCSVEIGGRLIHPRCTCQCQKERMEREEQEEQVRRNRLRIDRNRSIGLPSPALRKHTFENDLGYNREVMQRAKNYVRHWEEFYERGTGLLLWGSVGSGKSYIAGCIANALLDKGVRVMLTNCSRILNQLMSFRNGEHNRFIDDLCKYELLIIDDLGMERCSDFAREQIFSVIDSRYRTGRPLIVTTNIHIRELEQPTDLNDQRIFDRVLERCLPLCVNDRHVRQLKRLDEQQQADRLLRQ